MSVCKAPLQRSSWRGVPTGGVRQVKLTKGNIINIKRLYLKNYNKF